MEEKLFYLLRNIRLCPLRVNNLLTYSYEKFTPGTVFSIYREGFLDWPPVVGYTAVHRYRYHQYITYAVIEIALKFKTYSSVSETFLSADFP